VIHAVEFHVDPAGDDAADGSREHPWKTLDRVNEWAKEPGFAPGDSILLASGATFQGHLFISAPTRTTADQPLIITTSGEEPATIDAGAEHGIEVVDLGGVKLKNLVFRGIPGDQNNGVFFMANGSQGERLAPISIERVVASGFGRCGIMIGSWGRTYSGFDGISIVGSVATHNGESGIATFDNGHAEDVGKYAHKNLLMIGCEAAFNKSITGKNASGNGIVISGVDGGKVTGCRAHHNENPTAGGNVGIWTYSTRRITITFSISHHNRSAGKDGGGFDIDGGSQECVVENCYSFGNSGLGFMHCDYPGSRPTTRNVIRYCISENDGQKSGEDAIFAFVSWGEGITDSVIEYCTGSGNVKNAGSLVGLDVQVLTGYGKSPHVDRCEFRNNIVVLRGSEDFLARNIQQDGIVTFRGNLYWATGEATPRWQIPYEIPSAEAPNAEAPNAEAPNAEAPNAAVPDAAAPDAAVPDAAAPDAEAPDAEAPDAEAPNAEAGEPGTLRAPDSRPQTNIVHAIADWRMHGGDPQKLPESVNFGDPCFVGESGMGEVTNLAQLHAAALSAYALKPGSPAINLAEKGFVIPGIAQAPADFADRHFPVEAAQAGVQLPVNQGLLNPTAGALKAP
jgi:hypothetical protein